MNYRLLEVVVLARDLTEQGLRDGDLGTIVELHPGGMDVEFVTASGMTRAVVTLHAEDVRAVGDGDLLSVRRVA